VVALRELKGRHLLTLLDYKPEEIKLILEVSRQLKLRYYAGERVIPVHSGKTLMLIFEKPSTRTRVSLEVAARQLGMNVIYASSQELQLGRGEPIRDTARVLSRYVDCIAARVYKHESLEEMARYSKVPVINALSDKFHPLQALADALTLWEIKGRLEKLKVAFIGDCSNNVATSLAIIGVKLGWEVRLVGPRELHPDSKLIEQLLSEARQTGANIEVTEDVEEGVRGVDAVYTDVWVSMGFEHEAEKRRRILEPYRVTMRVMELAGPDAVFMHCLPARRGEEVTDDVIESSRSVVWQQAENRLHTAKAVLALLVP